MSKNKKKKRTDVRTRDWSTAHEFSFTHDLVKHRRAVASISDAAPQAPLPESFEPNAVVISHAKKWAVVHWGGEALLCLIDERLVEAEETLLAPGDLVLVERGEEQATIRGIAPRRSKLRRPAGIHDRRQEQVIAANVDRLVVVASVADPPFRPGLVDRYLIAAQRSSLDALLCINKADLADDAPEELDAYRGLGVRVICTSCITGAGIDELREVLRDSMSVMSGHSGVGKTSLLNTLDPALDLATQEISDSTRRGRHTTTRAHLYELAGGIRIIDTPGIRALGLWGVTPEEVACYFPELAEAGAGCRFRNCTHSHEPGCAVRDAVEAGRVSRFRYASYLRIRATLKGEQTRGAPASRRRAGDERGQAGDQ